jgi:hypothetical protein
VCRSFIVVDLFARIRSKNLLSDIMGPSDYLSTNEYRFYQYKTSCSIPPKKKQEKKESCRGPASKSSKQGTRDVAVNRSRPAYGEKKEIKKHWRCPLIYEVSLVLTTDASLPDAWRFRLSTQPQGIVYAADPYSQWSKRMQFQA